MWFETLNPEVESCYTPEERPKLHASSMKAWLSLVSGDLFLDATTACRGLCKFVILALNRRPHEIFAVLTAWTAQVMPCRMGGLHRRARGGAMTFLASGRSFGSPAFPM